MEPEDAFRKRACVSGAVGGSSAGGPDRLSSLPDCLLHTIMSFLKARQAVQTCVLATRWRNLWRTVPCLDIDFDEFKTVPASDNNLGSGGDHNCGSGGDHNSDSDGDNNSDSSDDGSDTSDPDSKRYDVDLVNYINSRDFEHFTKYKDWEHFEDFAVALMRRCNIAQMDSFRLHIDQIRAPEFGDRVAAGWLRRAMKYFIPDCAIKLGSSSGSWLLKRLHLCHVLLDSHFMKRVNSVCCFLEDLELDDCSCQIQSITSDSLKNLVLRNCEWHRLSEIISPTLKTLVIDGGSNTCVLIIMAPALAYLYLKVVVDEFDGGISLNEMPSIAKAFIHLLSWYSSSNLACDQFKLLHSISNSTTLELKGVGTMMLGKEPKFEEFKNLRNLLLDKCDLSDDFRTLVFFLRSSPILEKLTLRCCKFPKYSSKEEGTPILNKTSSSKMLQQYPKYSSSRRGMPILTSRRGMPILTSRRGRCKFPGYSNEMKGTPILKKISSSELHGLDLLCENLKVEIIYNDGYGPHLMELLLRISVNLSKNNIKLTKVD